ncbi:MAG: 3-oxoacyl-ACP reductase FabG [Dehalococcoidales bacterium]|nr:3-oxoacyl-ACP reductase FabG [Dehalococcoidales bacterium]
MRLSGKTAIITGSRRGIGKSIAAALAREGASVVICDVDLEDCRAVAAEIQGSGGKAIAVKCDVSVKAEVQEMVAKTIEEFGRVDILVNNAAYGVIKPFVRLTEEDWDRVYGVNIKGAFLCSQAAAKNMIKNGGGRIINISSVASGGGGGCPPLMASYVSTKGGLKSLSQAMAVELAAFGINVNVICPGTIDSGAVPESMKERSLRVIPWGRLGKPEDIAAVVVFLALPESDYITGGVFVVDGGVSRLAMGSTK